MVLGSSPVAVTDIFKFVNKSDLDKVVAALAIKVELKA